MPTTRNVNLGVLVSGSGSNLQSIIDSIEKGALNAVIRIVISNNPDAFALERARRHKIKSLVIDHLTYPSREDFERALIESLRSNGVELVVMAGFMRVLTPLFLRTFPMKIMNIHPAILPSFQGIHAQERAFDYGVQFSGCTVHFADEGVDTGPIIIQSVVPVFHDDTADMLRDRILREEHRIYPQAIQFYAEGRIEISGRKVKIRHGLRPEERALHNPALESF